MTPTVRTAILSLLKRGRITMSEAGRMAGVSPQAIRDMCQRAEVNPEQARSRFIEGVFRRLSRDVGRM